MTLTDSNLRYLLAIHHLAQQSTEVSPLALAQAMGVTKPSVTSILTSLMKQGVIVRRRYGKIYITDRGVLYARYYEDVYKRQEKDHEERYKALAANIEAGKVYARETEQVWQCRNCGFVYIGQHAPVKCPVCAHPQSYFELKSSNY